MKNACFDAPRRLRPAVAALAVALLAGVFALVGPAAPAGAATQTNAGATATCAGGISGFHPTNNVYRTCKTVDLRYRVLVNGADVAANTALAIGDVVTVSAYAQPTSTAYFYAETNDGIRNNAPDLDVDLAVGLPLTTGSLLSVPTNVRMLREDLGSRNGQGGDFPCLAQHQEGPVRNDAERAITFHNPPVGQSGMRALYTGSEVIGRWSDPGYDRCGDVLSNNALWSGFSISFQQTVLAKGDTSSSALWTFGGLDLKRDDAARSAASTLTWGTNRGINLTIPAGTVPGAPTIGTPTAAVGGATVRWSAPANNGGSRIIGYLVTPYRAGNAEVPSAFPSTLTTQVLSGLAAGMSHTFRVQARTAIGLGPMSAASAAVTPISDARPGAPSWNPAQQSVGPNRAILGWTAGSAGGSAITGYRITPHLDGVAQAPQVYGATSNLEAVTNLVNGTPYTFTIAASNAAGYGPESSHTPELTPVGVPAPPQSVSASRVSDSSALVIINDGDDGGSPITSYRIIAWYDGRGQTEDPQTFPVVSGEFPVVTGLTRGRTYEFTVEAGNAKGLGDRSDFTDEVVITGAPAPVQDLTVGDALDGHAVISWNHPANDGGSPRTRFWLDVYHLTSGAPKFLRTVELDPETTSTFLQAGFVNRERYRVDVRAGNDLGLSAPASVELLMRGLPGAPTIGTATAGDGRATVSWTAPGNDGGYPVGGYWVTPRTEFGVEPTRYFSSIATTQVITGLTNGETYRFRVQATNQRGEGSSSELSGPVTPKAATFAPFASWGALVDRLFVDLTTKAPTASQRSSWVSQLTAGTKSKGDLVAALRTGTDGTGNVDPATRLYRAFLQRTPDPGGLKFWVGRRRGGAWNLNRTADSFATSSEFKTKYGTLSNRAFVTLIYTDVLGRAADTAGVNFWTGRLDRKKATRGGVMVGFSESSEYQTKQRANVDVAVAYIFLLGRAPTSSEGSAWTTAQQGGTTPAVLAEQLLDSPAYAAHIG